VLGAIPKPFSRYVYYHGEKMRHYRADRLNHMFALRSFIDAGIRPTQASDYPPGPLEPMMALEPEVTRTDSKGNVWGPKQRITIEEAIRVGTLHGAYASYEESIKDRSKQGSWRTWWCWVAIAARKSVDADHHSDGAHHGWWALVVRGVNRF
jgi:predicted amidohydrolase YtcJ